MKSLKTITQLIESFHKLPGVGLKSAERMAYAVLHLPTEDVEKLSHDLLSVKHKITACTTCGLYTEHSPCDICASSRPHDVLIVLSYAKDVFVFERLETPPFRYHVLGGVLSASKGLKATDLKFDLLIDRLKKSSFNEVILAMDPTLEGETTAQYIALLLKHTSIKVTRLGYGLPMGAQLDYADTMTLGKALSGRTILKGES
jgi:recombination protein RecR